MTTVIIPTKDRPQLIMACLRSLFNCQTRPDRVIVIVDDDPVTEKMLKENDWPITMIVNQKTIGFWKSLTKALIHINYDDPFCYFGQDVTFDRGWLVEAQKSFYPDGLGLLTFRDDIHNGGNASHGMTTQRWMEVVWGEPRPPKDYFHHYCDSELSVRSMDLGRFVYCEKSYVPHHHNPLLTCLCRSDKVVLDRRHQQWLKRDKSNALKGLVAEEEKSY